MSFKKLLKNFGGSTAFAVICGFLIATTPGTLWAPENTVGRPCELVNGLIPVFNTLKIMALIGAVFCIAGWAWGYISAGKIGDKPLEELKGKGIALLVGFTLLTSVFLVLEFLPGTMGCEGEFGQLRTGL